MGSSGLEFWRSCGFFFATSQGKGVVDGVGGTIKRLVWKAFIARKASVVVDAESFYCVAKQLQSSVNVSLVDKEQILKQSAELCLKTCLHEALLCLEYQSFTALRHMKMASFIVASIQIKTFSKVMFSPFDSDDTGSDSYEDDTCTDNCSNIGNGSDYEDKDNDGSDIIVQHGSDSTGDENDEGSVAFHMKCNMVFLKSYCLCFRIFHHLFFHNI